MHNMDGYMCRDIMLRGRDEANGLWQAGADESSAMLRTTSATNVRAVADMVSAWARTAAPAVEALQGRIRALVEAK